MLISRELNAGYWALRISLGLAALVAGIDKFTNILTNWGEYLSPAIRNLVPLDAGTLMMVFGAIEIVVGLAILAGATRVFGYVFMVWMFAGAANLISSGRYYDIALREVLIGVGAYALAKVTEARESVVVVDRSDDFRRAA